MNYADAALIIKNIPSEVIPLDDKKDALLLLCKHTSKVMSYIRKYELLNVIIWLVSYEGWLDV